MGRMSKSTTCSGQRRGVGSWERKATAARGMCSAAFALQRVRDTFACAEPVPHRGEVRGGPIRSGRALTQEQQPVLPPDGEGGQAHKGEVEEHEEEGAKAILGKHMRMSCL